MKYILLVSFLFISACDGTSSSTQKIAVPQREALDKAKAVSQVVQQGADQMQEKINNAEK